MLSNIPIWLGGFNGPLWYKFPKSKKTLYLTFDDGPTEGVTNEVLDLLRAYNAKATFFCIGKNVADNEVLYQRIINQGHQVGNHTNNHLNGWKTEASQYLENVSTASQKITSNLFRPPYGKLTPKQYQLLKQEYQIVFWSLISWDFSLKISPQACFKRVSHAYSDGSVVLFHDSIKAKEKVLYTLPLLLQEATKKGYQFEVLSHGIKSCAS